ncbi:putative quinol monooxygenase [Nocardia niwae]|uniref:Antibiotic biosynthesis monooxygenase n=1 Tax=Nocardia niwae TaxID=626084 RepID=A0ABV2X9T1_9NOCA
MFALVVKFDLQDAEKAVEFDKLVAETVGAITEREPGTLVYATHAVENEPLSRVFYEAYRDRDAFEEHERQPHIRHFLSQREKYIASFRVEFLSPAEAKGLPAAG